MTPTTDDVAGLVARARNKVLCLGPGTPDAMLKFMSGIKPLLTDMMSALESQAKALREAEADVKYWKQSAERAWLDTQQRDARMRAAEARLKEAEKVIASLLQSLTNNNSERVIAARAFLTREK